MSDHQKTGPVPADALVIYEGSPLQPIAVIEKKCNKCDGHGYYYGFHVGPLDGECTTPIASSVTECDCGAEPPLWLEAEIQRWVDKREEEAAKAAEAAKPWWRR
jgi:hypothetical protein